MKTQSIMHKALSTTSPHFGPAVGKMLNGTHKYFRRIFCNNYPINYRETMVREIEGTPEERRERAFRERHDHFEAINRLQTLKNNSLACCDFGTAMMYQNQIDELKEKWEESHGVDNHA